MVRHREHGREVGGLGCTVGMWGGRFACERCWAGLANGTWSRFHVGEEGGVSDVSL